MELPQNFVKLSLTIHPNIGMIYVFKTAEIFLFWASLYLASKIVQQKYVSQVFVNNKEPPSLQQLLLIALGIFIALFTGLIVIVYLLKFLYETQLANILSDATMQQVGFDVVCTTVMILIFGSLLSYIMMKKKYFRYKSDGLRAIRGLEEALLFIAIVILVIPFFAMKP